MKHESKAGITNRLRREKRDAEGEMFRDACLRELRAEAKTKAGRERLKGMDLKEMAWDAMELAYPPLKPVVVEREEVELVQPGEDVSVGIPTDWGEVLENADPQVEMRWVAANVWFCRVRSAGGEDGVDLGRASSPAPSRVAIGMLAAAASNPNKFFLEVYPKFVEPEDGGEEEELKGEGRSIREIEKVLEGLGDDG